MGNVRKIHHSISKNEEKRSNNCNINLKPAVNVISKPRGMTFMPHSSFSTVAKLPHVNTHAIIQSTPLFIGQIRALSNTSDEDFIHGKPTLKYATTLRKTWASMSNEQILHFAHLEVPEACRECVIRDIMMVDQIDYDEAKKVFEKIAASNREGMHLYAFPFQAGFAAAFLGGWVSIPLVFDEATMTWFNQHFVTSELPPPEDLETWLEVGAASWGWMEPVLGQISFFLLCMQFARAQLQNLGIRPYFNWQREKRADRLVEMYPRYDPEFLRAYSKCDRLASPHQFEK
ncbi:hypothetical protein HJC23_006601 [Cyclotella cryptica]|uniref:Uncharacterized protein n=1 Tax=Cyclotella cryptica TaxID=29204 RepID=A0ABD3QX21_9STRA|eukprot:CCRYP_001002-RA/>CCRYP_001002-RA protein AED:0.36 eAED:0.36 QI:422/1/1/1/0.5/0.33/3/254/287